MSIFRDKQIKHFLIFVAIYNILLVGIASWFYQNQIAETKYMFVEHDTAIISSLLAGDSCKHRKYRPYLCGNRNQTPSYRASGIFLK